MPNFFRLLRRVSRHRMSGTCSVRYRDKFRITGKITARLTDRLSGLFGYKIKPALQGLYIMH